jgi:hypothetical protein
MSTRLEKTITINGTEIKIEIIRDGFNVWMPEPSHGCKFEAKRENLLGISMWHYVETIPCDDTRLILATIRHRAIFEDEQSVTEYMYWRVEKYLSNQTLI